MGSEPPKVDRPAPAIVTTRAIPNPTARPTRSFHPLVGCWFRGGSGTGFGVPSVCALSRTALRLAFRCSRRSRSHCRLRSGSRYGGLFRLPGYELGFGYARHNVRQAFHKRLFHGVSHHRFVLTAEKRPKPVRCHDALPRHIGRDLGRNSRNTEAPGEPEAELASTLAGNTSDLAARDLDATGDGERILSRGDIEDGYLGCLVIARMVVF
jgi:hypothetical protein